MIPNVTLASLPFRSAPVELGSFRRTHHSSDAGRDRDKRAPKSQRRWQCDNRGFLGRVESDHWAMANGRAYKRAHSARHHDCLKARLSDCVSKAND